jgi:hypothetical protein
MSSTLDNAKHLGDTQGRLQKGAKSFDQRQTTWKSYLASCTALRKTAADIFKFFKKKIAACLPPCPSYW